MRLLVPVILLSLAMTQADSSAVLESTFASSDLDLNPDPEGAEWLGAPRVVADHDYFGQPLTTAPRTEIRSRWTTRHLYLLYVCQFDRLNLKPDPDTVNETPRLWNWDVAEAFIGWDVDHIGRYKELQVSPQGEWVDLDIDRDNPQGQAGMAWNSGYTVRSRIDEVAKVWFGVMRIPFGAIDPRPPQVGRELRIGLYRIAGASPKTFYAWRPTGEANFHVPRAFGRLRLR